MTISAMPTSGLSYDPTEPVFWDEEGLAAEVRRAFAICHGCRMCFKYCDSFPTLFESIDRHDGDVTRLGPDDVSRVMDACFECKLCEVQCPYTPRDQHEWQLDFPALVHRYRAVRLRAHGRSLRLKLRDLVLARPDLAGRMARLSFGTINVANRIRPVRRIMELATGIHRDKLLPEFSRQAFDAWAARNGFVQSVPGGDAVLFQTCFVQHNEPQIGRDTLEVLRANGVDVRVVRGLQCCGMPAWEHGDLRSVRRQARRDLDLLMPFVERGAKVLAINPTCSMMLRREWTRLLGPRDRIRAARLAEAVMDPSEYLWSIRTEPRFNTEFRSTPAGGRVAYHAPCHLRAQAVGFKGRDLLRKIPGVTVTGTVMECCGHDGTYAMTVEGFEPSKRAGRRAFEAMRAAEAETWATDCPLAAIQFQQHAGRKPLHPMSILARAYRQDGFPDPVVGAPVGTGGRAD